MNWWNANRRDVPRTVVMYLSGQRGVKDVVSGRAGGAVRLRCSAGAHMHQQESLLIRV